MFLTYFYQKDVIVILNADIINTMNNKQYLCVECDEVYVHDAGNVCSVCSILLSEDESMYDEPKINIYKFR